MSEVGEKILEKIKEEKIKPLPHWEFLLKDYVLWLVFLLSVLVGSLAVAVIVFMLTHTGWLYDFNLSPIRDLLVGLPYFWLVILIIFLLAAWYNFEHTKTGYRYGFLKIFAFSVLASIVLGIVIYFLGGGERLEDSSYHYLPFYQQVVRTHGRLLLAPEQGRLVGVVVEINDDYIKIQDFAGRVWRITSTTPEVYLGQRIYLLGQRISEEEFRSHDMLPWLRPQFMAR